MAPSLSDDRDAGGPSPPRAMRRRTGSIATIVVLATLLLGTLAVPSTGLAARGQGGDPGASAGLLGASSTPAPGNLTALSVAPGSGYVSTPIVASGSGFAPGPVNLSFGARPISCTLSGNLTASPQGSFRCGFPVPGVPAGGFLLNASQPNDSATAPFVVVPPTLYATPTHAPVGGAVSATGAGYEANATVALDLGTVAISSCPGGGSLVASASGGLLCTFAVPALATGTYPLTANDSWNSASTGFTVDPATVTLSPSAGPVGSVAQATGGGFTPGASIGLAFGSQPIACGSGALSANASGGFDCGFTVPSLATGTYPVTANDSVNRAAASFTVDPAAVSVSPVAGLVGSLARATGSGFIPNTDLTLLLGGTSLSCSSGSRRANGSGDLDCSFAVPTLPTGNQSLSANDSVNRATARFAVETPTLQLAPNSGFVGSAVVASGAGYSPGGLLTLQIGGSPLICLSGSLTANASGEFRCGFDVPSSMASGAYLVQASDGVNSGTGPYTIFSPRLVLGAVSGPVGFLLAANGTGYAPGAALSIQFDGSAISHCASGNATADAGGAFGCTFKVPGEPHGTYRVVVSDRTHQGNASFTVTPSIQLTPSHGVGGTSLGIVGTGFDASILSSVSVNVTWSGDPTPICPTVTSPLGTFSCGGSGSGAPWLTPLNATGGAHLIVASEGTGRPSAEANFTVDTELLASPSHASAGAEVHFLGSGFNASAAFALTFGGVPAVCGSSTNTTDANGSFDCGYLVGTHVPGGTYQVVVRETLGTLSNSTAFTIDGTLLAAPGTGVKGTVVSLSGYDLWASTAYQYCIQSANAACPPGPQSFTTDSHGTVPAGVTLTVPGTLNVGRYLIEATQGGVIVSVPFVVTPASLAALPSGGSVGTRVGLTGTGFDPYATYGYCVLPQPVACPTSTPSTFQSNSTGAVPAGTTVAVPFLPRGDVWIDVSTAGGVLAAATTFTVRENASWSTDRGTVGSVLVVDGTGFDANRSVTVNFSGLPATACTGGPLETNATGGFQCSWTVPPVAGGQYQLTFTEGANLVARAFQVVPALLLSPGVGPAGRPVLATGTGFGAHAAYLLRWSALPLTCLSGDGFTNATGAFACTFPVPASAGPGPHYVEAVEGAYDVKVLFEVSVAPSLTVAEVTGGDRGPVGTALRLTGDGFAPGSAVSLTFAGSVSISTCLAPSPDATPTSNSTGVLTCYFDVPWVGAGSQAVAGSQNISGTWVWANSSFTVVPAVVLHPTSGPVGSNVTVSGTGFFASAHTAGFNVVWAGTTTLCTGTTGPTGNLSCSFDVPSGRTGTYEVFANDSHEPAATANFTVLSAAHGIPRWAVDAGLVAGVGAVIALVLVLVWRSRRVARMTPAASGDDGPSPGVGGSGAAPAPAPVLGANAPPGRYPDGTPEGAATPAAGDDPRAATYDELVERVGQLRRQLEELQGGQTRATPPAPVSAAAPGPGEARPGPASSPRKPRKRRDPRP